MGDNAPFFNLPSLKCENKFNLDQFLDKDVDLNKYFSKKELEEMGPDQQRRYKNIAQNYEIMLHMDLPAVKPDFMKGPAFRARKAKMLQKRYTEPASDSNSDDEDWTPDMESKKRRKEQRFFTPKAKYPDVEKKVTSTTTPSKKRKAASKTECKEPEKKEYCFREHTRTTNFMNMEPPDDDHFLYCEECNKEYDMDCPVHGPLNYIQDKQVTENDLERAIHTLPEGLVVRESRIPGAGLGVFAEKHFPARTKFGPYGGEITTNADKAHSSGYSWQIYIDGKPHHFVDAYDKAKSNWMRYVNCAVTESEQNLVAFQHEGEIYYRTFKPLVPGMELLVYYGDEYARDLGASRDYNAFIRPKNINGTVIYPCAYCRTGFDTAGRCVLHILRIHGSKKLTPKDIYHLDAWLRINKYGRYSKKVDNTVDLIKKNEENTQARKSLYDTKLTLNTKMHITDKNYKKGNQSLEQESHISVKKYKSTVELIQNKSSLVTHMYTLKVEKPYKCDVCEYACNRKGHLVQHMRIHTGEKPYKCDVCEYACNQKINLVQHMRTHTGEKPYKCDVCEFACDHKGNLVRHMRTHTEEKPYKCDVCEYACNYKSNLVKHMRIHTGEKPYKCDVCEYACNQKGPLVQHMRIHTGEKPYKCDVCEFACNHKINLVQHMRTHTGEKPYECDVCEYACNHKGHLVRHMRIHTGEKPYKCDVCEFACDQKGNLVRHMRIHTGEKPYKCDVCEYACNHKGNLVKHMRIHEKVIH